MSAQNTIEEPEVLEKTPPEKQEDKEQIPTKETPQIEATTKETPQKEEEPPPPAIEPLEGQLMLKVLSGPHLGGEIPLETGSYVIGSDISCDVVLKDEQIVLKHALLEVKDGCFFIRGLDGGVIASSSSIPEHTSTALAPYSPILIGNTYFTLGNTQGEWDKVQIPLPQQQEKSAEEENQVVLPPKGLNWKGLLKKGKSKLVLKLLGVGVAGVVGSTFFFLRSPAPPVVRPWSEGKALATIEELLKEREVVYVSVEKAENKTLLITGWVETGVQKRLLEEDINAIKRKTLWTEDRINIQIQAAKIVHSSLESALSALKVNATVDYEPPGTFLLTGQVKDQDLKEKITQDLLRQIPQIQLKNALTLLQKKDPAPYFDIVSVSMGEIRYVVLRDGQKYLEGAVLPGGWKIVGIQSTYILIKKKDKQIIYKFMAT